MRSLIRKLIPALILLFGSLCVNGQIVYYQGGYFEKTGGKWYEYRPQEHRGVHNYFDEVADEADRWVLDNGACQVALPKNPAKANVLLKMPGREWEYKYTALAATCPRCKGTGLTECAFCGGSKQAAVCNVCHGTRRRGDRICPFCEGKVHRECPACHGSGKKEICRTCGGRRVLSAREFARLDSIRAAVIDTIRAVEEQMRQYQQRLINAANPTSPATTQSTR